MRKKEKIPFSSMFSTLQFSMDFEWISDGFSMDLKISVLNMMDKGDDLFWKMTKTTFWSNFCESFFAFEIINEVLPVPNSTMKMTLFLVSSWKIVYCGKVKKTWLNLIFSVCFSINCDDILSVFSSACWMTSPEISTKFQCCAHHYLTCLW